MIEAKNRRAGSKPALLNLVAQSAGGGASRPKPDAAAWLLALALLLGFLLALLLRGAFLLGHC
jgi:hypothetical protein